MDSLCAEKGIGEMGCNLISWGLYFGYFAIGVAFIAALVLPLISSLKNPKSLMKIGLGIAVLLIIFGISYGVSDGELSSVAMAQGVTAFGSRMVSAGLITFYIGLAGTALGLIYSEVSKAIK